MLNSKRIVVLAAAAAATMCLTTGTAFADQDPVGRLVTDDTGNGVLVTTHVTTSGSFLQVCGDAVTYVQGKTTGALETSVVVTTQGAEEYGTRQVQNLTGVNDDANINSNFAHTCVSFSLHAGSTADSLTFEVDGIGTSLGNQAESSCYGTVARVNSGAWIIVSPCGQ